MSTVGYVPESGCVRQPSDRDRQVGWWVAATTHGYSLGNYRGADGRTAWVVQDRAHRDRETLGLGEREWDALRWENAYQAWAEDDRDRSHGFTAVTGRALQATDRRYRPVPDRRH